MTQTQLDTFVVTLQFYLAGQSVDLVNRIKYGDMSRHSLAARHMALHSIMKGLKDYRYSSSVLTDKQIFSMIGKATMLQQQNVHDS